MPPILVASHPTVTVCSLLKRTVATSFSLIVPKMGPAHLSDMCSNGKRPIALCALMTYLIAHTTRLLALISGSSSKMHLRRRLPKDINGSLLALAPSNMFTNLLADAESNWTEIAKEPSGADL